MNTALTIIKLGGSIITDKHSGRPILRTKTVRRLAREIMAVRRSGKLGRCIILHGAGSFGHPLVWRHHLDGRRLSPSTMIAVSRTIQSVSNLTANITDELLRAGLPAVPLQTSSLVKLSRQRLQFTSRTLLQTIMRAGGIPILGGALVLSDDQRSVVVSADRLAVSLANLFRAKRIIFGTDVDGVFRHFPPRPEEVPLTRLNRREFDQLIRIPVQRQATDVTGAMIGKLRALRKLRNGMVVIINGQKTGRLAAAFSSRPSGTVIQFRIKKPPQKS